MRMLLRGIALLVGASMMAAVGVAAEQPASPKHGVSSLEAAFTYDTLHGNLVGGSGFWMQGGSAELNGQLFHGLGVVADVSGQHSGDTKIAGVGLNLVTATFGPRYTWSPRGTRYSFYGQALLGEAFGFSSVFPGTGQASETANSMALMVGGGLSIHVNRHFALRAFKADWMRTQLPNATSGVQNNLRLGAGVVVRLP
jgi:hypothetical protein